MRKTFTLLILLAVGTLGYSQETTVKENRVDNPIRYDQQRKSQTVTQSGVSLQSGEIDAKSQGVNNPTVLTREQVQHQGTYQLPRESTIKGFAEMNPGRVTSNSERQLNVQSRSSDSFHRTAMNLGENNPVIFNRVSTSPTVNYPLNQDDIEAELLADAAYRASNPVVYVSPAAVANRPMADITPTAGATETFTPAVGDNFFDPGGPGGANSDGNAGNYPNCNCDTQTTLAGVSEIEFLDFGVNGTFDYLRIYDGTDATGTILYDNSSTGANTGDKTLANMIASHGSATFTSTSGNFFFFFHASGVVNWLGWDALIVATDGGGGGGDTCSEENPNDGTFENGFNCSSASDFMTANDVTVAAGEDFTLTNITASIFANGGIASVDVNYYNDAAGLPGTLIGSETGVTIDNQTVIGTNFGIDVNEIELSVDPFVFVGQDDVPTTYWIELSVTDGGATGSVFWVVTSSTSVGNKAAQFDAGWSIGDPLMDGVYIFEGTCAPTGGGGGGGTFPEPYCGPLTYNSNVEPITNVEVAGISNRSDAAPGGSPAHEDFTTIIGEMAEGESYPIALEGNTDGNFTASFTVFIDWNQDGILDNAGERYEIGTIVNSNGNDGIQATGTITVPAGVVEGETRMRVIKKFLAGFATDSCTPGSGYGQAEDYTIDVTAGGGGGGDTCFEENPNDGTFENGFNCSSATDFMTANDVTVAAGEDFTLTNITASIFANGGISNVDVNYYSDTAGLPGTLIGSETGVTIDSQTVIGTNFGFDVNEIELSVDPFLFEGQDDAPTTYWVELSVTDGGATGSVFWVVTSSSSVGHPAAQFDAGWAIGDPLMDGVYIFEGECEPTGGGGGGDTCAEENPNDGTFENGFNCSSATDFMTANDVTIPAGEDFTLTNITASIFANGGIASVDVNYYDDAAGLPGTLIGSETGVTIDSQTVIGTNFGFDVNEIELSVDPFLFEGQEDAPTTYWIELSVTDGGATGSVFWVVTSSSSVGHPAAQFDAGWAIGDPLMDGVYIFEGECEPTGGGGGGDTCAEENPNDGTFENGFNCSSATDFMTANDVTIPAGEDFTLTNITASIFANGGIASVDVNYYDDAAGLPGALIGSETGVTIDSQAVIGNNFGFDVNEIELSVEPFVFEGQNDAPTTYWIELSVTDGGATGSVFWVVTSSSSVGHPAAQFDAGWTIGDPLMDGVYIFEGECNATVGIEDNSLAGFNFYPNPANQMLYLNASKNIESVELFNMLGQKVMANQIGATSSNLNVEGLAVGTYIMKVTVDGQTGTYKVIKN